MRSKRNTILILLLLGAAGLAFAQGPAMRLEYYENFSAGMYVRLANGSELEIDEIGMGRELPVGSTLITLDGDYAELRLQPAGTILRISENTNFTVNGLQGREGAAKNTFTVALGKIRAVVAKRDGAQYAFRGDTAVCGVRGTQFFFDVLPGKQELAWVKDGVIDYTDRAGRTIALGAGLAADALAADFRAFSPPPGMLQGLQRGMDFVRLRVQEVEGYLEEAAQAAEEAAPEEEPGEKTAEAVEPVQKAAEIPAEEAPEAKSEPPKWLEKLMKVLGLEIGTVTIADETWAKAIIQPRFALGKLKVGLYLPVIYKSDMLDPGDWYHPDGNDEWSFGTDQGGEWDAVALDVLNDLFLKIRYLQYGDNRDPFFFKLGNLDNITLGHGSIMRMYANDADFPAVRKVGLDLGVNRDKGGLQLMVDDAGAPQIFGLRGYLRPIGKLGMGLSAVADIDPLQDQSCDLMFLNGGLDLDLPVVERQALAIVAFADVAAMLPYQSGSGLAWDAVWYDGQLRNWGLDAGILGNLLMIDYRLEFLWSNGLFRPGLYGPLYDRGSPEYAAEMISYLADPSLPQYETYSMGVYGELGYEMPKVFYLKGGYLWPWPVGAENSTAEWPDDQLWLQFGIFEDLLPLYGSISMTRRGLAVPLFIQGDSIRFFDENLVFSGELVYPFSPLVELALSVSTNVVGGTAHPTVSILTRVNP